MGPFTGTVGFAVASPDSYQAANPVNNMKTDTSPGSAGCYHAPRQP